MATSEDLAELVEDSAMLSRDLGSTHTLAHCQGGSRTAIAAEVVDGHDDDLFVFGESLQCLAHLRELGGLDESGFGVACCTDRFRYLVEALEPDLALTLMVPPRQWQLLTQAVEHGSSGPAPGERTEGHPSPRVEALSGFDDAEGAVLHEIVFEMSAAGGSRDASSLPPEVWIHVSQGGEVAAGVSVHTLLR